MTPLHKSFLELTGIIPTSALRFGTLDSVHAAISAMTGTGTVDGADWLALRSM